MSAEYDRAAARPPLVGLVVNTKRGAEVTLEEADEARRHAAEIGDYVSAERWLGHERLLATRATSTERPARQPPVTR